MIRLFLLLISVLALNIRQVQGEPCDTLHTDSTHTALTSITIRHTSPYRFNLKQLIFPTALITAGCFGLKSDWLIYQNREIRNELQENSPKNFPIDNYSQFAPIAAVYGLNLFGVKGLHNFRDRTIIIATASILMTATVKTMKAITNVDRPDGGRYSFPSGHTATAFMSAEYLWQEYREISPWIGVAGYAVATGTGFLRLYNNKHWLTDVVAGAGIGILSTKAVYWLFPTLQKLFVKKKSVQTFAFPQVSTHFLGLGCFISF